MKKYLTLKERTKAFARDVILLCRNLPSNQESWVFSKQLIRAGTSVASNYRSACRGRSKKEFISKLGIVEEEVDESIFWLELIQEVKLYESPEIGKLKREGKEILAMVIASKKTARKNLQ